MPLMESLNQNQMKLRMLLTHEQETTLWHFMDTIVTPSGVRLYSMPFFLKPIGGGEYERMTFDELPEDAKEMVQAKNDTKISL